jgi:hypothetical protein
MSRSKSELVAAIASELGVETPRMSTGSTEPKTIFLLINESLGLGLSGALTKPELARALVESAGNIWTATCESRGGTVTAEGLQRVLDAVRYFLGAPV